MSTPDQPDQPDAMAPGTPAPSAVPVFADPRIEALSAKLNALANGFDQQAEQLATMASAPGADAIEPDRSGEPLFIVAFDDPDYYAELALMTPWVDQIFSAIYGPEPTAQRPWCVRWPEHPEAVARLHALWLAWQGSITPEAGAAGPSAWHRDHLEPALAKLRGADGPFAACTSSGGHVSHRLLETPAFTDPDALNPPTAA
ncbi:DUF4913 domain-containing protein [Streptacidiphilus sp. MAP5-52]|uniref:DUF4913 domain-containing protein n=1 Tax=Streptacidiphilus sp. MAP5-52 TaxID=3156267 RepID=UPI003517FA30